MGHELPCPSSWSAFFPPGTGVHSPAHPHPYLVCPEQGNRLWKLSWGGGAEQGGARGGLVTPVVACPPLPVSAKPADAGRGSGDKLCRYMRALQRSPFPIQPASLHPSNIQGSQVPLLPFLPPWPLCCLCPPPVEDWKLPTSCWEHTKKMNLQDKSL